MLIDLGDQVINTDHIVLMKASANVRGQRQWSITLSTGDKIMVQDQPDLDDQVCGTIVPAPAGLTLVEASLPPPEDDDQSVRFTSSAVLAFRITDPGSAPEPIGRFGESSRDAINYCVLQPDGTCQGWERIWDSFDAFKAEQQAEADAQREPSRPSSSEPASNRSQPAPPAARHRTDRSRTFSAGVETVEQIRARILAEPIKALTPDAPWRPDRDLTEVVSAVREANPQLHYAGFGHDPKWGWKWKSGDMERHRAAMTDVGHVEEFERALHFLSHAAGRFPSVKVNHRRTSYSWKHAAERVMGGYVSNGMLVAAAYALGFTVATDPESPNPCINLGEKAAALDPQRGL